MDLYSCIAAVGGLAFFLYGMNTLSSGLKNVAGVKLENILGKMTDHPMKGLLFGAIITIAMQSSSALTVMLVGLVNSGIMTLSQTVGIIMGSNIGTTLTAWLLSLSGMNTDNVVLSMMKPENFAPLLALLGVIFMMAAKEKQRRELGTVMVGFAILMHGMEMMSDSLSPLAEVPEFTGILTAFQNPLLGVIIGMLFTGIIQSSAASVGVLQALSLTGHVTYAIAIPIIMGQNIGTCVTALLSSIGVSKNAKRVSIIHVSFNMIGTVIGLAIYLFCKWFLDLAILDMTITPFMIAAFHSVFNVATTLLLLPFGKQLVWIAEHVIREDDSGEVFLDDRLLLSPAFAATECRRKAILILKKAVNGFYDAMNMLDNYDNKKRDDIHVLEEEVDEMVEACNSFLIRLSEKDVSPNESRVIADILHDLGDMERISDYSLDLTGTVKKIHKGSFKHKNELQQTLAPVNEKLFNILSSLTAAYENKDKAVAGKMITESAELVSMIKKIKKANLRLLRVQKTEAEGSVYLSDYLTISRRVAEHSANIAESLL